MFKVINKENLAKEVTKIVVKAEQIARKAKAGQFVVVIVDERGERIPLTLADWDKDKGTITLIFQKIGFSTKKLGSLNPGDKIEHILGPLGHPTEIKKWDKVVCIGGGVGIAEAYPVCRAFKEAGNYVIGIIGTRNKDLLILEKEMKKVCDELFITTDDGSYGEKGFVSDVLKRLSGYNFVYAVGPIPMMQAVSKITQEYHIKTIVSLNPIMVDATGMCGACRLRVGNCTVFGCVDGPDFDAHAVDFEELSRRLKIFTEAERKIDAQFNS
ncbi:MAG: sulfide/dihydroorotate dehydrogenase-like FAD/NAD-binding protein [Candidatus Omnitrophica bacterium]|nr:sulfide/dihydroorotate dehydrogenase-like FAD/NAD-binding protein [Candidatus Omnitrophota bacterium]